MRVKKEGPLRGPGLCIWRGPMGALSLLVDDAIGQQVPSASEDGERPTRRPCLGWIMSELVQSLEYEQNQSLSTTFLVPAPAPGRMRRSRDV